MPSFYDGHDPTPPWAETLQIDTLAAFDDRLVGRFRACTACGAHAIAQSGTWVGLTAQGPLGIAFTLCEACVARLESSLRTLDRLLCLRYGVEEQYGARRAADRADARSAVGDRG